MAAHASVSVHNCKDIKLEAYNSQNSNQLSFIITREDDLFDISLFNLPDDQFNWLVMAFGKDAKNYAKV